MKPSFRIAWAWLTGAKVVATKDFDGQIRYRIARINPFGTLSSKAIIEPIELLPDGRVRGCMYCHEWTMVWPTQETTGSDTK